MTNNNIYTVTAEITEGVSVELFWNAPTYVFKDGGSAHLRYELTGPTEAPQQEGSSLVATYVGADGKDAEPETQARNKSQFKSALRKAVSEGAEVIAAAEAPRAGGRGRKGLPNEGVVIAW